MQKAIRFKDLIEYFAVVDDEDGHLLNNGWVVDRPKGNYVRIKRHVKKHEKTIFPKAKVFLHQEVWIKHHGPIPEGMTIDHIDHNPLNNQKRNLQLLTQSENSARPKRAKT